MVAKKQNLEFFLFQFFYFHINDGQHVKLHESTNIFKLARCKKPEFWAIFSVKSKMAAKKRDLEIFCFSFFIFISMMVYMLNFKNLATVLNSLDAKNLNSGLLLA